MSTIEQTIACMARAARQAARAMARSTSRQKASVLQRMAEEIIRSAEEIKAENRRDLDAAKAGGLAAALIDRLTITDATIAAMAQGLREVAQLPDPVGSMGPAYTRPNGLQVARMRIPLGVIGIIYESRPNVTVDAAGLCLKSGNAVILRGGKEAMHSNRAIHALIVAALREAGLPAEAVQFVNVPDRAAITHLVQQEGLVDVVIPRGG